jgi:hypothetical protein
MSFIKYIDHSGKAMAKPLVEVGKIHASKIPKNIFSIMGDEELLNWV